MLHAWWWPGMSETSEAGCCVSQRNCVACRNADVQTLLYYSHVVEGM